MLQFIRSEEICELEKRINAKDVSNNVEGRFKVLKVPYQLLEKEQFQHIVKDFADQYKLPYADFVKDPVKWDAEFGIATWKQMMTEMEFETSWTSHIYLAGGVAGYLTGRFFRATRSFQPESVGVEELKCDQVPVGATLIMDQDLIIFLARSSVSPIKQNPSGLGRKRVNSEDDTSDEKLPRVDPVAITDIDWTDIQETLQDVEHKKPCSLYIIKRVQDVYIEKIDALEARFSSVIEDLKAEIEDLKKKREAENARIDSVAVHIDAELKKREEKLQRQEALLKEKDSIVITLRQEVQAQKTELETQQNTPSQVQDLQSKNSVLESKIKLTETELTEALSNVQILEGEVRELKTNINSQQTSVAAPITKLPAPNLQVKQSVSVLENDSSSEDESPGQDDSMRSAKRSKSRTVIAALGKPVSISKYGIPVWNESETTLLEHLSIVTMGLALAKENEVTSKTVLTSLVLQSLPQKYNWAREFLDTSLEVEKAIVRLVELLVGDKSQLLSDFMKVQRRRDEQLLQYFTKLRRMYAYATSKELNNLETDAVALQLLVQKLKDGMETVFSTEFTKRIETQLDAGSLTMTAVSNALMKISTQMTQAGHLAPVSSNIMAVKTTCAYCGKVGHMVQKCWKKRRENGGTRIEDNSMGTSRESKTDGRQGQKKSFRCYGCNEIGHIRRNCPRKAGKS